MNRSLALAAALAAASLATPALAILTRADRDDEEYRELATRYPAAVSLEAAQGGGVLIAPRWILTAANRAARIAGKTVETKLWVAGQVQAIPIQAVFVHPDWRSGGDADIALVFLREPVTGVEPSQIYRDGRESGETVRVVGFGATGRIGAGAAAGNREHVPRAAINTIDRVRPLALGLRLKGPEEASDLQGALGPGDLGAPAFVEIGGRVLVAGIASRPGNANADRAAGSVGDWETYARVSAFAAWIDDVMSRAAVEEATRETAKPRR